MIYYDIISYQKCILFEVSPWHCPAVRTASAGSSMAFFVDERSVISIPKPPFLKTAPGNHGGRRGFIYCIYIYIYGTMSQVFNMNGGMRLSPKPKGWAHTFEPHLKA